MSPAKQEFSAQFLVEGGVQDMLAFALNQSHRTQVRNNLGVNDDKVDGHCSGPGRNGEARCVNAVSRVGAEHCISHEAQLEKNGTLQPLRTRKSKTTCVGPGQDEEFCGRKVFAREPGRDDGVCKAHYEQMKRRGYLGPIAPHAAAVPDTPCYGPGQAGREQCDRAAERGTGLCDAHDRQRKKGGPLKPIRAINTPDGPCVGPGPEGSLCGRPIQNKTNKLCGGHYGQHNRGVALLPLKETRKRGEVMRCAFLGCRYPDAPDAEGLCRHHWRQKRNGQELVVLEGAPNRGKAVLLRDEVGNKYCPSCAMWKPVDDFSKSSRSSDGLNHRCRRCHASAQKKAKYGITLEEFEDLLASQGGKCAICPRSVREDGYRLSIDHDHRCCPGTVSCGNCIRGILCPNCNRGLGLFAENPERLAQAIAYLQAADG
jgi:hypothetical protein